MANQQIQQLEHDGKRLFCPAHPARKLDKGITEGEHGPFTIFCTAPVPGPIGRSACMRSAEWSTEADRDSYFAQTSSL